MHYSILLPRRRILQAALGGLVLPASAFAQDNWPARPVRIVVPSSAGGGTDAFGRIIAQALTEQL
jgi:tripartite-type tricarboxylate transporter receptor subunit TctC